jgi:hypothetical protein
MASRRADTPISLVTDANGHNEFGGMRAPAALAKALGITDAQLADGISRLQKAGVPVSIHKTPKEPDPPHARHTPVTTDSYAFSYSAADTPSHENCCGPAGNYARARGLYLGTRKAGELPHVHGIAVAKNGRTEITAPIMSATEHSRRAVIAWDAVDDGTWARELNVGLSPDRRIVTAMAAAIHELAYEEDVPRIPAAVTPSARTETGHIPAPVVECLPSGYWDQPDACPTSPARLRARAVQASIASRRPKIALTWGASIGAAYAAALKLRTSGTWELTGALRKGKTTTLMLAAAAWGNPELPPDGMLISWDQSSKGTGRYLGELGTFPAFMDETGTADFGPDEWGRLHYSLSLGASRTVAKTRGSMGTNRTPGWQSFLFTTGNATTTDGATAGRFGGVPARVVTLSGEFTLNHGECDRLDRAVLADYGWLGPEVIRMVSVDEFGRMYQAALDQLGVTSGGVIGTLARKMALAVAGARAIDQILGTGTRIGDAAIQGAWDYLDNLANPETDRERILRDLAESMSAERSAWADQADYDAWGTQADRNQRKLAGLYDETWVYVYQNTWKEIIEHAGIAGSARLALADMHDRGELHVLPTRRQQGTWKSEVPSWGSQHSPRVLAYQIRLAALGPAEGDGDPGPSKGSSKGSSKGPQRIADDVSQGGDPGPGPAADSSSKGSSKGVQRIADEVSKGHTPDPDRLTCISKDSKGSKGETASRVRAREGHDDHHHQAPEPNPEYAKPPAHREGNSPMTTTTGPPATTAANPRTAFLDQVRTRKPFDRPDCLATLTAACTAIDATPPGAEGHDLEKHARTLKLADALVSKTGDERSKPGPFAPTRLKPGRDGKSYLAYPWWQPWKDDALPVILETARVIDGYNWQRPFTGPATVLDRNAAQIAAAASVQVAHGQLTRTGPLDEVPRYPAPGYYLIRGYPWTETGTPDPLNNLIAPDDQAWIPAPTMALLRDLADAGRWPDASALDSWTGEPCRLYDWARLAAEVRGYALTVYGRGTPQFEVAKVAFSMAKAMMLGNLDPTSAQPHRHWRYHFNHRRDWPHHITPLASANLWRITDQCHQAAQHIDQPELAPVALRNTDELVIPTAAIELVTTVTLPGHPRPPVRIDPTTLQLGTFKIQGTEDR